MKHEANGQADTGADDAEAVVSAGAAQTQQNELTVIEQSGVGLKADVEAEEDEIWQETELDRVFATADPQLQAACLTQLATALYVDSDATTVQKVEHAARLLAMVKDVHPRDGLEGGLIVQMLGLHDAAMEEMRRAVASREEAERQSHLNLALKLTDKYAKLMGALDKRRNGGEQRIRVDHTVKLDHGEDNATDLGVRIIEAQAQDAETIVLKLKQSPAFDLAVTKLKAKEARKVVAKPVKVKDA